MKKYLQILQTENIQISEEDLYTPIRNIHIDSIDLVVLRVTLEKYFGFEIPDKYWFSYQTLAEALEYFDKNKDKLQPELSVNNESISDFESVEIGMPQMANSALSESWLLKFLGDKHWQLLTKGFNKKSSEFKDENHNRLYATFLRVKYEISQLTKFTENDTIHFTSTINGFGNNTFLSRIYGKCLEYRISATLMTTFSVREQSNNKKITKCEPKIKSERITQLLKTPLFLNDYRLLRKGLTENISTNDLVFKIVDDSIFSCNYDINPYYDINGVGLLYYAAYPIISDKCLLEYDQTMSSYHTVFRDTFYFANSNAGDKIIFKLNTLDKSETKIKTLTSLFRESDNQLLARILTVKQK